MSRKRPARSGNPDLRRGMQVPGPHIAELDTKTARSTTDITSLVKNHKMLGLIKQERKRHRENVAYYQEIWGSTA